VDFLKYHSGPPCRTHVRPAGEHPCNGFMAVTVMAARRASGLRPSYYPFGYPMMYASEEEEKGRVRRGRGKERRGAAMVSLKFH
jgi:hypothetical protein